MRYSSPTCIIEVGLLTVVVAVVGCALHPEAEDGAQPAVDFEPMRNRGGSFEWPPCDFASETDRNATAATDTTATGPALAFHGAYPNPFNPSTEISFVVPADGSPVTLAIHSVDGRRARVLLAGGLPAGEHVVTWRGRDDRGRRLPSGVYVASLSDGHQMRTRKLVMVQ